MTNPPTPISIIMRSKNDGAVIRETLSMLYKQTICNFELLNVDSGSSDNTVDLIREFPGKLTQIPSESYIPGRVLNSMVNIATGKLIVLLNSDATPANEVWLENLLNTFNDPTIKVAFSRQIARNNAWELVKFDYLRAFPSASRGNMPPDFISFASAAFRRETWEASPFYEEGLAEDHHWAHNLVKQGTSITYIPHSIVVHSHNLSIRSLYRKEFYQGGMARVHIFGEQPDILAEGGSFFKAVARDILYALPKGLILSLFYSPIYRFTQHLAFYRGRRKGAPRYHGHA